MSQMDTPVELTITCWMCGEKQDTINMTHGQLLQWRNGVKIQHIFPEMTTDTRELIVSGTCGTCFDKLFPPPSPEE